jgi:hypothetical protein
LRRTVRYPHHFVLEDPSCKDSSRISVPIFRYEDAKQEPHDIKITRVFLEGKEYLHAKKECLDYMLKLRVIRSDEIFRGQPQNQVNAHRGSDKNVPMWHHPRKLNLLPWSDYALGMTEKDRYEAFAYDVAFVHHPIRCRLRRGDRLVMELQNHGNPITLDLAIVLRWKAC